MYKRLDKNFWKKYFRFYDVLNELKPYSDTLGAIVNIIPKDQLLFILEIGCGTGNLLYRIIKSRNNIYKIFGIDYSQEALNTAREKLSDFKNFELFYGDINVSLPFGDNIFDVLVMHNVLYTIDSNSRPFLSKEMYRILKPGGLVIMANINTNFKPTKIYSHHIVYSIKTVGFWKTLYKLIKFIYPTIAVFYYNILIQLEHKHKKYNFIKKGEQQKLLSSVGFHVTISDAEVYAGSSYLTCASK